MTCPVTYKVDFASHQSIYECTGQVQGDCEGQVGMATAMVKYNGDCCGHESIRDRCSQDSMVTKVVCFRQKVTGRVSIE